MPSALDDLRATGALLITDPRETVVYSYDALERGPTPAVVAMPRTTAEVAGLVRAAGRHGLAIVPRGAASGLSGGSTPVRGETLVITSSRMTRLRLDPGRRLAFAQPGVVNQSVQDAAADHGLRYPPDPASLKQCTIGGNIAENAGGPACFKYGVTSDWVEAIEIVDPRGGARWLERGRGRLDLAALVMGSEGTLAFVTDARLRLAPVPPHRATLMVVFDRVEEAGVAVSAIVAAGLVPASLELMDQTCLACVEEYLHAGLPTDAGAVLIVETDGDDPVEVEGDAAQAAEFCGRAGAREVRRARDETGAAELWSARRAISPALARVRPHKLNEDIVVPRSSVPAVVDAFQEIASRLGLTVAVFGHAGDGNLHPNILYDRADADETRRTHQAAHEIVKVAVQHGGTLSGEHGIGLTKRIFMDELIDPALLAAFRAVRRAWDPGGHWNPGKLV
jgi:glycolate oxidase